ncbi:FAD-binding oxidoreductase [Spirosoma sp. HMF3257]|uniref:FAD-binding oxidoreductase n=1 Tax=Spirosoma telluris TaxID=2183553 RepID=A0A327NW56_9BACT|nr:FAD-binding oxidoreductase [Spirosoma telluris]RAI77068.1 FAD-binding oxidoreductase [Spirosoma telluris]
MKQLFLTLFSSLIVSNLLSVQAQDIRAAGDKMPEVRKTSTAGTPATYKLRQIIVGNGGGITGASTTYYLLENGKLFGRRNRDVAFTYIGQQTAANTKRVFRSVEVNCKIKMTRFDNPGNIYKFVQWRKGKLDYKVTWGAADKTVPANYPKVYDSFMAMIPASLRLK